MLILINRVGLLLGSVFVLVGLAFWLVGEWLSNYVIGEHAQTIVLAVCYSLAGVTVLIIGWFNSRLEGNAMLTLYALLAFCISLILFLRPYSFIELAGDKTSFMLGFLLILGGTMVLASNRRA